MVPDHVELVGGKQQLPVPAPLPFSSQDRREASASLCLGVHPGVTSTFSESLTSALSYVFISIPPSLVPLTQL